MRQINQKQHEKIIRTSQYENQYGKHELQIPSCRETNYHNVYVWLCKVLLRFHQVLIMLFLLRFDYV